MTWGFKVSYIPTRRTGCHSSGNIFTVSLEKHLYIKQATAEEVYCYSLGTYYHVPIKNFASAVLRCPI